MPREGLPWEGRDFRKYGISGGEFGVGGPHRWRDQQLHTHAPPPPYLRQQQRWYSYFRPPRLLHPGSRYADRNLEYENCQPFGCRGDGGYSRNNRENWGSFTRKDWKAPSWEPAKTSRAPAKPMAEVNNLWPMENSQECSGSSFDSHLPPDSVDLSERSQFQLLLKEKNNKNGGIVNEMTGAGKGSEEGNCLRSVDWKPLKLARLGSLSSSGSRFSNLSSSKSDEVGSTDMVAEVQPKNESQIWPLSNSAYIKSTSPVQSDKSRSRKKPRLGWGEGLAKYEKKKVGGPEDGACKNELVISVTDTYFPQWQSANLPEKSPGVANSSGVEENEFIKEASVDRDTSNLSCSLCIASQAHDDPPAFNIENLELTSFANLRFLINELLQFNNSIYAETSFEQTASMNKLMAWKFHVLKALEVTESEIESLETELKSLIAEPRICYAAGSGTLPGPGDNLLKPCEGLITTSKRCGIELNPLEIDSSGEMIVGNAPYGPEDMHILSEEENIDSPGSATSKFVEHTAIFPFKMTECVEGSINLDVHKSINLDEKCSKDGLYEEHSWYADNHVLTGTTNHEVISGISSVHCDVDNICDSIFSSNRDAARRAMRTLNKLLPDQLHFDISIESSASCLQRDPFIVKDRFLMRKRFIRFKEKVLSVKFNVFQHFWKEGRLVSLKKLLWKTKKKFGPSREGHKRNHSFLGSRSSSNAGGLQIVSADEVIGYINCLLSESPVKPYRNTLKMPALVLEEDMKMSRFISNNGLVEDPCAVEKERSMINPWTTKEKEIFLEKLATFGKDFGKIASFLDHKSVAECIEFYYKNHKSECFEKANKTSNHQNSQSTTYLVASGKRRNPELNAASLDIFGAASENTANIDNCMDPCLKSCEAAKGGDGLLQESDSTDMYSDEREIEAADVLASICGSFSSEAVSSCITSSVDHPTKWAFTPGVMQEVEYECSDESCGGLNPIAWWSDEEKSSFVRALSVYGKDFALISQFVGTRSMDQCKLFFSKTRKRLGLDQVRPGDGNASGDDNGGGSDIEDGCTVKTSMIIGDNGQECKMEGLPSPDSKLNDESETGGPDVEVSEGNNGLGSPEPASNNSSIVDNETVGEEIDDRGIPNRLNEANSSEGSEKRRGTSERKSRVEASPDVSELSTGDCRLGQSMSDSMESSQIVYALKQQSTDHSGPQSGCSYVGNRPSRISDVKLFGKIIVSSQQKTDSSAGRTDDYSSVDHKMGRESINLKHDANQTALCYKNYVGTENVHVPIGNLGFLDRNMTQSGISRLPDSALSLAKYPPPFSGYPSVLKPEQMLLHGTVKNGVGPASVYPSREADSSNGLADYRGLSNRDLQSFTVDVKHPQNAAFAEIRRRNAFDLGRGGGFVGGQRSSLSDPDAAMKMHYAKAEQLRIQGGNLIKEVDRWMSRNQGR